MSSTGPERLDGAFRCTQGKWGRLVCGGAGYVSGQTTNSFLDSSTKVFKAPQNVS